MVSCLPTPMENGKQTMAAGSLWSLLGLLSGAFLGLSLGLPGRLTLFLATLGLAMAWFGFSGTYGRLNAGAKPESARLLSEEEARVWLDTFLVKQQRK